MSLARAFTTRRANRNTADMGIPQRSNSTRPGGLGYSQSVRHKISAPMELTHTTNMLAYNAPDLYPQSASSSTDSSKSEDDSDGALTHASSPPTSPEVGSVEDLTALPLQHHHENHLSCDFTVPGQKHMPFGQAPSIPKRAPSHTKKASYEAAMSQQHSRYSNQSQRSASTKASFTLSRTSSTSTTATTATSVSSASVPRNKPSVPSLPQTSPMQQPHRKTAEAQHPFGQELARVTELAEDYGVKEKLTVAEQEEREIVAKGLRVFRPEDYLADIQSIFATFFLPEPAAEEPIWI